MTVIKLHKTDLDRLKSFVDLDIFNGLDFQQMKYDYFTFNTTEDFIDLLQDHLIDKLMKDGFNSNFEINSLGNQIESLIDKISKNIAD